MQILPTIAVLSATLCAHSQIIDTTPVAGYVGPFSDTAEATWGQVFVSPAGPSVTLDLFQFNLQITEAGEFGFFVYAWDGDSATGSALYTSPTQIVAPGILSLDFTPNASLASATEYVAFVNNSDFRNSGQSLNANIGFSATDYADGDLYFQSSGSDFGQVTSSAWTSSGLDSAFRAEFTVIPENEHAVLAAGVALAALVASRLRRNKQQV